MASVRVAVRLRPLNKREKQLSSKVIIQIMGNNTSIRKPSSTAAGHELKVFSYDFAYDSTDKGSPTFASQEKIYKDLGPDVLKAAFEGVNACIFAYGQTGSGKSYTMMGHADEKGIIPRICEGLYSGIDQRMSDAVSFCTEVSYLEIYNERVQDLLKKRTAAVDGGGLRVREHPLDGPYVENLSKRLVHNHTDMEDVVVLGNSNRSVASTGMNNLSSRSHAIFTICFTQACFDPQLPRKTQSKIHLVDLAGSERADTAGTTGIRLKEGANINKSLVTLGSVISSLAELGMGGQSTKKKQVFIPYRDSALTWLLKDSLGGNSVTTMIATISPAAANYSETLSTLRYASRAKNILNCPTVNEDGSVKVIRELKAEVTRLRRLLEEANQISHGVTSSSIQLEEQLHLNEEKVSDLLPCGGGTRLSEGRTLIGSDESLCSQGIVLHGPRLPGEHCVLENCAGTVTMIPQDGELCSVNGSVVTGPCHQTQGSITQLGTETILPFNHPSEAAQLRNKQSGLLTPSDRRETVLTDRSKLAKNPSKVMLQNPCQADVLNVESSCHNSAIIAIRGNDSVINNGLELNEDPPKHGVNTGVGQKSEGDMCHKSGPGLMSDFQREAQSATEVPTDKGEEFRSGDASLQQTGVLGLGDGCGVKLEGNTNKIQGVTADCDKRRPGSVGSSLGSTSHLQSSGGSISIAVLPQLNKCLSGQAEFCSPEKTSFKAQGGREEMGDSTKAQNSRLSSLGSKVAWFVQDAGHLIWSSATVLLQVREEGLQYFGSGWSSHVVSLIRENNLFSFIKSSQVFSVNRAFIFSLLKDSHVYSVVKDLPLVQQIHLAMMQVLWPEEAAGTIQDSDNLDSTNCPVPTPEQTLCKVEQIPADSQNSDVRNIRDLQSSQDQEIVVLHVKHEDKSHAPEIKAQPLENSRTEQNVMDVRLSCQTLIDFPDSLLRLQSLPLQDLMDTLQPVIPTSLINSQKTVAVYWLSVAKCSEPKPRPALLILVENGLYTLTTDSGLLVLFHYLPLFQLEEVQISFAGRSLHLMGATVESVLSVYTHSQKLTKELCCAILVTAHPGDNRISHHPLLHGDLMTMSLDWKNHVPDLLLDAGLRVCCHFQKSLADLVYLLYQNMNQEMVLLGEIHIIFYTTVGVCVSTQTEAIAQLILTDTHLGLVQEDTIFYPDPCSIPIVARHTLFHGLTLHQRSDVRCVVVHDEDESGAVRMDVILVNMRGWGLCKSVSKAATPAARISNSSPHAEVWKLTFSCSSEAACLINHLSNV